MLQWSLLIPFREGAGPFLRDRKGLKHCPNISALMRKRVPEAVKLASMVEGGIKGAKGRLASHLLRSDADRSR